MNDFFNFFDKQNIYTKTTAISIVLLMPFWYVCLFLINKDFFFSIDIVLRVVFSFCLALVWYFEQVFFLLIDRSIKRIENNIEGCFKLAAILSIFSLCVCIAIMYHSNYSFKSFLYNSLCYIAISNILGTAIDYICDRKEIKKRK